MIFPGEQDAVLQVLAYADQYGYGNLIAHLRRAWALKLMQGNDRLNYEEAVKATNSSAYPEKFDLFETGRGR